MALGDHGVENSVQLLNIITIPLSPQGGGLHFLEHNPSS